MKFPRIIEFGRYLSDLVPSAEEEAATLAMQEDTQRLLERVPEQEHRRAEAAVQRDRMRWLTFGRSVV